MFTISDVESIQTIVRIGLYIAGAIVGIILLRGVLKVAWKVINVILVVLAVLLAAGYLLGYLNISVS